MKVVFLLIIFISSSHDKSSHSYLHVLFLFCLQDAFDLGALAMFIHGSYLARPIFIYARVLHMYLRPSSNVAFLSRRIQLNWIRLKYDGSATVDSNFEFNSVASVNATVWFSGLPQNRKQIWRTERTWTCEWRRRFREKRKKKEVQMSEESSLGHRIFSWFPQL